MSEQSVKTVGVMICAVMIAFLLGLAYVITFVPRAPTLEQRLEEIHAIKSDLHEIGGRLDTMTPDK